MLWVQGHLTVLFFFCARIHFRFQNMILKSKVDPAPNVLSATFYLDMHVCFILVILLPFRCVGKFQYKFVMADDAAFGMEMDVSLFVVRAATMT